jgi:hypothetical protein
MAFIDNLKDAAQKAKNTVKSTADTVSEKTKIYGDSKAYIEYPR